MDIKDRMPTNILNRARERICKWFGWRIKEIIMATMAPKPDSDGSYQSEYLFWSEEAGEWAFYMYRKMDIWRGWSTLIPDVQRPTEHVLNQERIAGERCFVRYQKRIDQEAEALCQPHQ